MIVNLLINLILLIFGAIFVFLPEVSLIDIPVIGTPMVSALQSMVHTWNGFMITFPYAQSLWEVVLYVIIPFELLMLVAKFFLGNRMPTN